MHRTRRLEPSALRRSLAAQKISACGEISGERLRLAAERAQEKRRQMSIVGVRAGRVRARLVRRRFGRGGLRLMRLVVCLGGPAGTRLVKVSDPAG